MNVILQTDSYKVTHWKQYPPGTTKVFSYFESRGGIYKATNFFGLQHKLYAHICKPISRIDVQMAKEFFKEHFFGQDLFNEAGWHHIVNKHGGYLPLEIRAVPEGTSVPVSNVLMSVVNTDPEVPWLTNYVETILSQVWYTTTVATLSRYCRDLILEHLENTGTPEQIDFKLHDFGYRGSTSNESAALGGLAHLISFQGSDTLAALVMARKFYGHRMAGFSVPAAEHSTITSWGREHEKEAFENMLDAYPNGFVAVVSDSYDIYSACEHLWGESLREKVLNRQGTLVVRPDSGLPPEVVRRCVETLGAKFGYTVNTKGYKVLNDKVRVIQGDGVDPVMIDMVLNNLSLNGWSADNVSFGMGGALLQKVNRDTCKFAFKCSAIERNGAWHDVSKSPITDPGKNSKAGRLELVRNTKDYKDFRTVRHEDLKDLDWKVYQPVMQMVYKNGGILKHQNLDEIRERAKWEERRKSANVESATSAS